MNIGLEALNNVGTVAPSMEDLMGQYVECEQLVAASESFFAYGEQLHATFENLISLRSTAKRYGSTEGMTIINDLVKDEFHGACTVASLEAATESVWDRIKKFFAKIWAWIKEFFYRVLNFFGGAENRLSKLKGQLEAMKTGKDTKAAIGAGGVVSTGANDKNKMKPWNPMVPKTHVIIEKLDNTQKKVKGHRASAKTNPTVQEAENLVKICEEGIKELALTTQGERNAAIEKVDEAINFVDGLIKDLAYAKNEKRETEMAYNEYKGIVDVTKSKGLVKEAQAWQKACSANMKFINKNVSVMMRVAAHTLANCKAVRK